MAACVRLVCTAGLPIVRQLRIEEALLRATTDNWCLVNDGAAAPAAVLGLSGRVPCLQRPHTLQGWRRNAN